MNLNAYKKAQVFLEALPSIQGYMTKRRHPAFYFERMKILLKHLNHPEHGFNYVHVTGTSGKGSVTMMLHNILRASGKNVGTYCSPHTTTVAERILANGKTISVEDFVWGVEQIKHSVSTMLKKGSEYAPSYFEALFAVALLIFKKKKVSWVVLEVGCGGEFDATNTIPSPRAAIITNVHLDHMHLLGRTRKAIADTKSGIIKPHTHVFTGETDPSVRARISLKAKKMRAPLTYVPEPKIPFSLHGDTMHWKSLNTPFSSHLLGRHQLHNAMIAMRVAQFLKLPSSSIRKGIEATRVPCRSEIIQRNPVVVLDGAHNPAKISALVSLLKNMNYPNIHAIIGIGHNKQHRKMLASLAQVIDSAIFTQCSVEYPQPANPYRLRRIFQSITKKPSQVILNPFAALKQLMGVAAKHDLIVVTGSLYLTGELRTRWIPEKTILTHHSSFPYAHN